MRKALLEVEREICSLQSYEFTAPKLMEILRAPRMANGQRCREHGHNRAPVDGVMCCSWCGFPC